MTHVLVSRPMDASKQLAGLLAELGLSPIVMPFYTFSPLSTAIDFSSVWSVPTGRKLAVFTSPRAVSYGLPRIPHEHLSELEYAVTGSASATALKALGLPDPLQAATGYTSEDLLQVPELGSEPGAAIIFCAPGGRKTLATGLSRLGWNVIKAMVYERQALEPDKAGLDVLAGADRLISIWTSISALTLAQENLPRDLWKKILTSPALVISIRIQHHLRLLGAGQVTLTEGPGNAELIKSIRQMSGPQKWIAGN